jgi:quinol monooxygenase YgiN
MRISKSSILCTLAAAAALILVAMRSSAQGEAKSANEDGKVCVGVMYTIRAGHEDEAANDLRQLAVETRKEPGNLLYVAHRSIEDPHKFLIYEQYRSQADLETHRAKAYFQRYSVDGLQTIAESHVTGTYRPL